MQREIKFRAWDKRRNRFQATMGNLMMDVGGHLYWQFGFDAPEILSPEACEDYVLQQYSGLKDKNGKEIFEGDIVETFHYRRGIVEYHAVSQTGKAGWTARDPKVTEGPYNVDMMGCCVIGNIYENNDLLTNEK